MNMQKHIIPAIDAVRKVQPNAMDSFLVCDLPGLAEASTCIPDHKRDRRDKSFFGGESISEAVEGIRNGNLAGVAASDSFLDKLESQVFLSKGWRNIDDVVGAVPNIPAFIAGIPTNMRRRVRVAKETAPLAIFAEGTLSGGIEASQMRKRGAAILALVRALSGIRPVELHFVVGIGEKDRCAVMCVRIDTAPLDLARAAHVLTSPAVTRGVGYQTLNAMFLNGTWAGNWAYGSDSLYRSNIKQSLLRVVSPGSESLYIPAAHLHDKAITDPVAWLKEYTAQYGGLQTEAA